MLTLSNNKSENKNVQKRRKLRNENLELILQSSEALLEDFIELEAKVSNFYVIFKD